MQDKFTHLGLFEGIGGFSLAARWMGWETKAWCEWNEFGQKVLRHHFPEAEGHGDITKTDFTKYANTIDILTGGFPCQPYSVAGKRKGKEDERHLWPEMLRAIREVQPTYVVGENVSGLISWDGGLVFNEVQTDLETAGYEVWPYVLPACAVNAPHRRDRVWFIAYSNNARANNRSETNRNWQTGNKGWSEQSQPKHWENCSNGITKNTDSIRWAGNEWQSQSNEWEQRELSTRDNEPIPTNNGEVRNVTYTESEGLQRAYNNAKSFNRLQSESTKLYTGIITNTANYRRQSCKEYWQNFPTQPPICGRNDGLPTGLDNITFPKWRNESIKAYGNAIVPQVAFQIFKAIIEVDNKLTKI